MTAEVELPHWVDYAFLAELGVSALGNRSGSIELYDVSPDTLSLRHSPLLGSPVAETTPYDPGLPLPGTLIVRDCDLPAPLSPLTQEKGPVGKRPPWLAGFTCGKCPQPMRPYESRAGDAVPFFAWDWRSCAFVEVTEFMPYIPTVWETVYTARCTNCATSMKRWLRSQRDWEDIATVAANAPGNPSVVFVTLTMPNTLCSAEDAEARQNAVRAFKREVSRWRRSVGVSGHFLGGFDYYEQTETADPLSPDGESHGSTVSLNSHHHGVWVMSRYWDQSQMQDSWGRGIVHIKKVRNPKQALRYVTKYVSKQSMRGVRTRERWGLCRGTALSALRQLT